MNSGCLAVTRWHVTEHVVDAAWEMVADVAAKAISARGVFHVVLAGGNTPRALYERLISLQTDWSAWQVWFGDERCLPADHGERNSHMACAAWLQASAIPADHIHVMHTELGAEAAVVDYEEQLREVGMFDLVLLGLGEDGHTASLFPGHGNELAVADVIAVQNAPKPPSDRVSLSARRLSNARHVVFLVTGAGKRDAVVAWRRGEPIPAATICPAAGVDVLVESVCMGELP